MLDIYVFRFGGFVEEAILLLHSDRSLANCSIDIKITYVLCTLTATQGAEKQLSVHHKFSSYTRDVPRDQEKFVLYHRFPF